MVEMPGSSSRRSFLERTAQVALLSSMGSVLPVANAKPSSERLKIGQIGVGHSHAEGKMQVLRSSADWEVVGVVETDPQLREEALQREAYRDLPWLTEEQLLETPGLRAVAVETRVADLIATAERCVARGFPIHLDKPPGTSPERLGKLLETAASNRAIVQMGYMYRYNPAIRLLREVLAKGWLGEIFEVHAVMSKKLNASKRKQWAQFDGGAMFDLGSHLVDLVVGILGRPTAVTSYVRRSGLFGDDLADNVLAVCEYQGATAAIRSTAVEVEGGERRHLVVCGREGTLHIQPLDAPVVQLALDTQREGYRKGYQTLVMPRYERYVDDFADLAAILRGEKGVDFDSEHDLIAHETLMLACGAES